MIHLEVWMVIVIARPYVISAAISSTNAIKQHAKWKCQTTIPIPYASCMEYLPTFALEITQFCR